MNTPVVPMETMNGALLSLVEDHYLAVAELAPRGQELIAERDALLASIEGKLPDRTHGDLCDLYMTFAVYYAGEMFRYGLELGLARSVTLEFAGE